jgi:cell wall-associated NlpC family hydrolase
VGGETPETPRTPGKERLPNLPTFWERAREAQQKALEKALARQANNEKVIPAEAKKYVGSSAWAESANRPPYGPGRNKCNLFVYEVLNGAGTPVSMKTRLSISQLEYVKYPPLAGQWADPRADIPGWEVVTNPRPGDVVAMKEDYSDASGHVGIVTGPGTSASVSSYTGTVVENDWGFRADQKDDVVFRRYVGPPEPPSPPPASDRKWPTRGRNAP